jgi:hypothetical protein
MGLIDTKVDNLDKRLESEFDYLISKYPQVAFNINYWGGQPHNRGTGRNILLAVEGYITFPRNYEPDVIRQYDVFITHNSKFKALHPELSIALQNAPANWENYYELDSFLSYDEKIKGVCCLGRVYSTGVVSDINFMKDTVMKDLAIEPELCTHAYGQVPFGKPGSYKGWTGYKHSHENNLKILNQYLFCWCPEPMYHEVWSYNYVTERLFNCFKSKTVAIYYGCYNIEEMVPTELFIDYRNFKDSSDLSKFLLEFYKDEKKYNEMVENAYEWNLTCRLGDIALLEDVINDCIKKYPFRR